MYIKKDSRRLFEELDENLSLPKGFYHFLDKISEKHNLIIKKGSNNYYCTNCQKEFQDKKMKINSELKCPYCHLKFTVKGTTLKHFDFGDTVGILDRYKNYWIIRYFEVLSSYNGEKFVTDTCEFGRKICDDYFNELHEIINDHTFTGIGVVTVKHDYYMFAKHWRYFTSYWKSLGDNLIYYPGNLKKIFKNTKYKYSQMWDLAKHRQYFDLRQMMRLYDDSYEFLIKLKLYNLVGEHDFSIPGSFQKRFGIGKEYLPFMQKYNLDYDELQILKYYKKQNIRTIRAYKDADISKIMEHHVDLDLLLKNTDFKSTDLVLYNDYLRFAKQLGYDMKDKKILYPKNIGQAHDKFMSMIEIAKNKTIEEKISKRCIELKKNIYKNKKYIIFPASSIESLISESRMQNNCVKSYAERYANKECDIYFMRLLSDTKKSLVTVEVRDSKVVQQRIIYNDPTTDEQNKFLKLWEQKILCKKERYNNG